MRKLLACLVGVVWGLSLISGAFAKEYTPAFDGDVNEEEIQRNMIPDGARSEMYDGLPCYWDDAGSGDFVLMRYDGTESTVVIPDKVTKIGKYAFYNNDYVEEVILPDTLRCIATGAFKGCDNLKSVNLPTGLEEIYDDVFYQSGMVFDEICLPKNVKVIIGNPFGFATGYTAKISVDPENPYYDSRDNCNGIVETATNKLIVGNQMTTIPKSVTKLGKLVYPQFSENVNSIIIPEWVEEINYDTIGECNDDFIIFGYEFSAAQDYAAEINLEFGRLVPFSGVDVVLSDVISIGFYYYFSEAMASSRYFTAMLTYPDGTVGRLDEINIDGSCYQYDAAGTKVFGIQVPFAAKEINDRVTVTVYDDMSGKMVTEPVTYSIRQYCDELKKVTRSDAERDIADAVLTYGTYAQDYFNYRTDAYAKDINECVLSNASDVLNQIDGMEFDSSKLDLPESMEFYGSSLVLDYAITLKCFYKVYDSNMYGELVEGRLFRYDEIRDLYVQSHAGISILELDDPIITDYYPPEEGKECTITPMSYVVLALRRNYDDRLNNICIALYDYYTSAKTYDNYLKSLPSGPDETGILN